MHLCGYDLNLTYPQASGKFPTLNSPDPSDPASPLVGADGNRSSYLTAVTNKYKRDILKFTRRSVPDTGYFKRSAEEKAKKMAWKRRATLQSDGTVNPWYGCFLSIELYEYMLNYTKPWSKLVQCL